MNEWYHDDEYAAAFLFVGIVDNDVHDDAFVCVVFLVILLVMLFGDAFDDTFVCGGLFGLC